MSSIAPGKDKLFLRFQCYYTREEIEKEYTKKSFDGCEITVRKTFKELEKENIKTFLNFENLVTFKNWDHQRKLQACISF